MSKCRYDLSEDCNNTDCLKCVLDRIKRDVFNACCDNYHMPVHKLDCDEIFDIIDKYTAESEDVPDTNNGNIYRCSCGYGWDKSKVVRHHFCPNCGCRMVDPTGAEGSEEE